MLNHSGMLFAHRGAWLLTPDHQIKIDARGYLLEHLRNPTLAADWKVHPGCR
jgi:hypothetical protein